MNYNRLIEQLKLHEGVRDRPYKDSVGKLTIGVGRNLTDKGLKPKEIEYLLMNDIMDCIDDLNKYLPWWRQLNEVRQRVLMDMCFNLGIGGLLGFKNTLAFIQSGDYEQASQNMLSSKWASQVGQRSRRLSEMIRTGQDYEE
jgi:lysozyme